MATVTPDRSSVPEPPPLPGEQLSPVMAYGDYIESQLRRTRGQVKWTEFFTGLVTLAIGALIYVMAVVLIDRLMPLGGLGRWLSLLGLLIGGGAYFIFAVLPPLLRRVNPVYAAQAIESNTPSLKNSLINLLLLRRSSSKVPQAIINTVEQQAATGLSSGPVDGAVDRSRLIKLGYVLVAIMAVCAIYKFASAKDPLQTIARVVVPWSDVKAPTRVTIEEVTPGDAEVLTDQSLTVSAWVRGHQDDPVMLYYSTLDQRITDKPVKMELRKEGQGYECNLPPEADGLQQDVQYYVAVGDARTRLYRVRVLTPPAIEDVSVRYEYPEYTRLPGRATEGVGDLQAIEGTRVTLSIRTNQEIATAAIDFHCDGTPDRQMQIQGKTASVRFPLRPKDTQGRPLESYQIRFSNKARYENPHPVRYRIEVIPDQPPEVNLESPRQAEMKLPVNAALSVKVWAKDPDFGLSRVSVLMEKEPHLGSLIGQEDLLSRESLEEFAGTYRFSPSKLNLHVGDEVLLWAVARDNRRDGEVANPNVAQTQKLRIKIVEEGEKTDKGEGEFDPDKQEDKPQDKDGQNNKQQGDQKQAGAGENDSGNGRPQKQEGDGQGKGENSKSGGDGQPQEQPSDGEKGEGAGNQQGADPNGDPSEAFEKIQDHLNKQDQQQPNQDKQGQDNKGQGQQPQDAQQQNTDSPSGDKNKKPQDQGAGGSEPEDGPSDQKSDMPQDGQQPMSGGGSDSKPGQTENTEGRGSSKGGADQAAGQGGSDPMNSDAPPSGQEKPQEGQGQGEKDGQDANSKGSNDKPDGEPDQKQADSPEGQGASSKGSGQKNEKPPSGDSNADKKGGDPDTERGSGGAGEKSDDDKGSPAPHEKNQPKRDKQDSGQRDPNQPKDPNNAQSPTTSEKESSSESDTEGDRSGGGSKGGGQSSNNAGTGGAGQNTAADEGKGVAEGSGKGEDSNRAGDKSKAEGQTGKAGEETGDGSTMREGEGDSGSGKDQQPNSTPPSGKQPGERRQGGDPNAPSTPDKNQQQGQNPGNVSGGSNQDPNGRGWADPKGNQQPRGRGNDSSPLEEAEDPNLEYTKEATDLVLDKLKNQMENDQVDPELLKDLGWSKEQLAQFVKQWEQVRQQADQSGIDGEVARERLRNLGLKPQGNTVQGAPREDAQRGLRSGFRSAPPREYQQQFRAFSRSKAKGRPPRE